MSDSASVYEPDDAESESDFDLEPPRERSPVPAQNDEQHGHADSSFDWVGMELGDALMLRDPPMRGPLTFLPGYAHFLQDMKEGAEYTLLKESGDSYQVSQHGSVVWTSTEKEVFFNVLDRKGKGSIKELAAAIGTKSELEVMAYIRLLHKALEAQYISDKHVERMPVLGDVPAALEVSRECCELLEEYAEVMVYQESLIGNKAGEKHHGDNWLITTARAQDLVDDKDDTARGDLRLAAGLFNLPDWIRLSQVLFMNFNGSKADDNWWNLVSRTDNMTLNTASMTADSVVDFYSLAVSVTRRLIQSSLFFAMSRLRSANRSGRDRKGHVRLQDVRAAIEVLNMKHRRPNFVDIARRNEIVIEDVHNRKGWVAPVFSYEEAEEIIDKSEWFRYRKDGSMYRDGNDEEDSDDEMDIDDDEADSDASLEPDLPSESEHDPGPEDVDDVAARESSDLSSPLASEDELEMDPEEEHAELADESASRRHELDLLRLMEQPLPSVLDERLKAEETEEKSRLQPERRIRDDLLDWRDRTLYRSEWEEYGYDLADLKEVMEMPPNKRPKFNEPAPALPDPLEEEKEVESERAESEEEDQRGILSGDKVPAGGKSWLQYYMTQFGQPGEQQKPG
jgi:RNA polymerase I-specific transcription initiation factor RRN5